MQESGQFGIDSCRWAGAFIAAVLAILIGVSSARAGGANFSVLYNFGNNPDGVNPQGLIHDKSGNIYGTTVNGGGATARGTVFKLTPDGTETVLYSFCARQNCTDGQYPNAGLFIDKKGNLYGTTAYGGAGQDCVIGCGTVFEVTPDGKEKVLYSFTDGSDGGVPNGGLTGDTNGNLYGTTLEGGNYPPYQGVVFKVSSDGTETVLHSFCGADCKDGNEPEGGLIIDTSGNLYGTTSAGGGGKYNSGIVFKLAPDGSETVLYSFTGGADGGGPAGVLMMDKAGDLYGATPYGGKNGSICTEGCGVIFKIAPDGAETVLYSFAGGKDGGQPLGPLIEDPKGNLYGTTSKYGMSACGVLFEVMPDGKERVLHTFTGANDGCGPDSVIWNPKIQKETLNGATFTGGSADDGVIFALGK